MSLAAATRRLGLSPDELRPFGDAIAKLPLSILDRPRRFERPARLVLVSAMTPTPAGAGKTTTSIGLAGAMLELGHSVCLALREPSMGPTFGKKGGATGGGKARLVPMERINLHFTGDFHAVTSAHNLVAAVIDNHLHFGSDLDLDPRSISWPRVLDVNDRALRDIVVGLGGRGGGVPRESRFEITAASEIMATLCLSESRADLRERLERTLVGARRDGRPVTIGDLKISGALAALLDDAMEPNLVRTLDGAPALVHGGPFANIAHGCNSVIATKMAMHLADWTITEAGFGFDLGAEKFFDIKCRAAGLDTAAVVLVATIRALKMHGGVALSDLDAADAAAVERGLPNLRKHIENIQCFGERPVVALNRFSLDREDEVEVVRRFCRDADVPFAVSDHFTAGAAGAVQLAETLIAHAEATSVPYRPLYAVDESIEAKILAVASKMYGAAEVSYTKAARRDLTRIARQGYDRLPVCIAKVPGSLSDDPRKLGRPRDFTITVREIEVNAGAGFLVVLTGDILRMPGLPRTPAAEQIDIEDGRVTGMDH